MTKTFKVAAAQVRPVLFDLNGSLNKVLSKIQEAATKNVKLIVFPETSFLTTHIFHLLSRQFSWVNLI